MAITPLDEIMHPHRDAEKTRRELVKLVGGETTNLILAHAEAIYGTTAALAPKARPGARHLLLMSSYAIALHQAMTDRGFDPERANDYISDIVFDSIRPVHGVLTWAGKVVYRSPLRPGALVVTTVPQLLLLGA